MMQFRVVVSGVMQPAGGSVLCPRPAVMHTHRAMPPCLAARIFLATMPMPKLIATSTLAFSAALSPGVQGFSVPATAVTVRPSTKSR